MTYQLKLDQFEGPLDLLLQLIEDRKLDITRVSLAQVSDQYIGYLQAQENVTLEHLSDFLTIATRLLLIKSKALLPLLELTQEEEDEMDDLAMQLAQYKRFKEVCVLLEKMLASHREMTQREAYLGFERLLIPEIGPTKVTPLDLHRGFLKVLDEIPNPEKLKEKILRKIISLEDRMFQIRRMVLRRAQFTFSELTGQKKDRIDTIVSFLAVLELIKQRFLDVRQDILWGEIELQKSADSDIRVHSQTNA